MLKKRKDTEDGNASGSGTSFSEKNYTPSSGSANEKTIIGEQISIEGSIRGKENLLIEGSMKGKIELEEHQVIVGPKGKVEAEIHAKDVTISGRMTGNIQALGKVEITRAAEFNGEVSTRIQQPGGGRRRGSGGSGLPSLCPDLRAERRDYGRE